MTPALGNILTLLFYTIEWNKFNQIALFFSFSILSPLKWCSFFKIFPIIFSWVAVATWLTTKYFHSAQFWLPFGHSGRQQWLLKTIVVCSIKSSCHSKFWIKYRLHLKRFPQILHFSLSTKFALLSPRVDGIQRRGILHTNQKVKKFCGVKRDCVILYWNWVFHFHKTTNSTLRDKNWPSLWV